MLLSIVIISCKDNPKPKEIIHSHDFPKVSANKNLNISVLLDLSDRINPEKYPSPAMDFYRRDIGYLKTIAENFEAHIMNKKLIKIDDKYRYL